MADRKPGALSYVKAWGGMPPDFVPFVPAISLLKNGFHMQNRPSPPPSSRHSSLPNMRGPRNSSPSCSRPFSCSPATSTCTVTRSTRPASAPPGRVCIFSWRGDAGSRWCGNGGPGESSGEPPWGCARRTSQVADWYMRLGNGARRTRPERGTILLDKETEFEDEEGYSL